MKIQATATVDSVRVLVGTEEDDGFAFGETAEIWAGEFLSRGTPQVEVSFAAIGAHDAETGIRRANNYLYASLLAKVMFPFVETATEHPNAWEALATFINAGVGPFADDEVWSVRS